MRTCAEYIHVSMRYLLICADNLKLDDQNHYYEYLRTYAENTHAPIYLRK